MPELPPTFRDGRYAVVRVLGEGSQATTFEAVDKKAGRPVAVKRFRVRGAKSWKEVELAEREARVLPGLDHPALPRYVEHFEEGGELFLVTEKIEGESLSAIRARGSVLAEHDVVRLLREASLALDYLHGRAPPIVHRDLKPSNVIRRPDGSFAFIDFGAVRDRMKPEGGSTVVGTFGYMAPEQFQGRAMPASDVYSMGATALAMLTGREPEDLPHRGLAIDVPAALAGARVSPSLVRLLSSMLEPDPDRRAKAIGPGLERMAREAKEGARPEPRYGQEAREARQRAREERREQRREQREIARRAWWAERGPRSGGLFHVLVVLALVAAQVAVMLATRVVVPTVLVALSIVFGKGLREAARAVSAAGGRASEEIARARQGLTGSMAGRVRIAGAAAPRARVEDGDAEAEAEEEAAAGEEAGEARRRR